MYFHGNGKHTCRNLLILRANCPSTWIHFDSTFYFTGNSRVSAISYSMVSLNVDRARQRCCQVPRSASITNVLKWRWSTPSRVILLKMIGSMLFNLFQKRLIALTHRFHMTTQHCTILNIFYSVLMWKQYHKVKLVYLLKIVENVKSLCAFVVRRWQQPVVYFWCW